MSCDPDRLLDHLDGALDERAQAELDDHLAGCPACRDELRALRRATALAAEAVRADAPVPLRDDELRAMLAALPAEPDRAARRDRIVRLMPRVVVAATAAALAATLLLVLRGPEPAPTPHGPELPPQEQVEIRMATGNPSVQVIWVMSRDLEL